MVAEQTTDSVLLVRRTFRCARERLFEAWTSPEQIKQWYGPSDEWDTPVAEIDLRVGGAYRFGLAGPGRDPFYEVGEFLEIDPPSRLVYSQRTEGGSAEGQALVVTVEFVARGADTEVVVTERGYTVARVRDMHQRGWQGFLRRLARLTEGS